MIEMTSLAISNQAILLKQHQQIRALEVEGYLIVPDALTPVELTSIRNELADIEKAVDDDRRQLEGRFVLRDSTRFLMHNLQFELCPSIHRLIADGVGRRIISEATGDDLVCLAATYAHCKPGYGGIKMHTDYDPNGNDIFRPSNQVSVRVLYYLDNLTIEKAPLRILPHSHVSLKKDLKPDRQFAEEIDGEIRICCEAGTAVLINPRIFHGVGCNTTDESRRAVAITYRPRWARPYAPISEHPEDAVLKLSPQLREYFTNLNG